jgi:hypothetical protein
MWRISWSNSIIRWQDYRVAALRLAESNFRHTQSIKAYSNIPWIYQFHHAAERLQILNADRRAQIAWLP